MTEPQINKIKEELNQKYYGNNCYIPANQKMPISQEDKITFAKLDIAEMMLSNLAYGQDYFNMINQDWYIRNSHGKFDWDKLTDLGVKNSKQVVKDLWEEMKSDFYRFATVRYNTYEDSEGLTYNSVEWAQ